MNGIAVSYPVHQMIASISSVLPSTKLDGSFAEALDPRLGHDLTVREAGEDRVTECCVQLVDADRRLLETVPFIRPSPGSQDPGKDRLAQGARADA